MGRGHASTIFCRQTRYSFVHSIESPTGRSRSIPVDSPWTNNSLIQRLRRNLSGVFPDDIRYQHKQGRTVLTGQRLEVYNNFMRAMLTFLYPETSRPTSTS